MKVLLILPIRFYRYAISPLMAPHCRFYPSCSAYAEEAIRVHGAWQGSYLAMHRLLRCHPGSAGGYDPVPEKTSHRVATHESTSESALPCEANKAS
ncbi:MAG: membrane protein insertion efficiency factor YidD [Hydrogenophaga sp.]|uniref:membrane protein insertion efficiency factor YidD n=1 Tax=Hydrogenophaga sp. TaxID=1904254 RepID=UPI00272F59E4|nr:membrane protein insertion efficiency factor YidD [Hydrogenophaga sp.]MDP2166614.1 membrane protein insertion efficiency factor YidD [Hydrogenophaga sp.]